MSRKVKLECRVVLMMSPAEVDAIDEWRKAENTSMSGAIRHLVSVGICFSETIHQLRARLARMDPQAAALAACGHPLVQSISLNKLSLKPAVIVHFQDGSDLKITHGDEK